MPVLPSHFSRSFSSATLASALMPLSWVLAVTNGILACSNLLMPTSTRTLVSSQRPSPYSFASPVSPSSFCESSSTQSKRFLTPNTTGKLTWPQTTDCRLYRHHHPGNHDDSMLHPPLHTDYASSWCLEPFYRESEDSIQLCTICYYIR